VDQTVVCLVVKKSVHRSVRVGFYCSASHFLSEILDSLLVLPSGLRINLLRIKRNLADGFKGFWTLSKDPTLFPELILVISFDFFRINWVTDFVRSRAHLVLHVHTCQRKETRLNINKFEGR